MEDSNKHSFIDSRSKKEVIKVHEMAKIQIFEGKIHQGN